MFDLDSGIMQSLNVFFDISILGYMDIEFLIYLAVAYLIFLNRPENIVSFATTKLKEHGQSNSFPNKCINLL